MDVAVANQIGENLPKSQVHLTSPLISFTNVSNGDGGEVEVNKKGPPPKRPPPPKFPSSQSTGNLSGVSASGHPGIKTGGSFVEQTPLLGLPNSMAERSASFMDVTDHSSSTHLGTNLNATNELLPKFYVTSNSEYDLNSNLNSACGSSESVSKGEERVNMPAPPSNCNSYFDLTDPPSSLAADALGNETVCTNDPFNTSFDTNFDSLSLTSNSFSQSGLPLVEEHASLNRHTEDLNGVEQTGKVAPPPLPPKTDRHKRPIPFTVPK